MNYSQDRILVTGGAGFVGSNLVKTLLGYSIEFIQVVDNFLSSEKENLPTDKRLLVTEGSISNDDVLATILDDYDYIFHLSTYHGNQSSIQNPLADHENNLLPALKLFDHIKNFKRVRKVVYSGAGCAVAEKTFERARATPEDAPISLNMDSPYSISKIVGEFYAVYFYNQCKTPIVRARFQNVYGPGEILGAGKWRGTSATVWRNVIPTFIYKALKKEALPLEGGGQASRDFIFVGDIIEGLLRCATFGLPSEVYNLASGVETSIFDLAQIINELTHNPTPPRLLPRRDWDHSGRRFGDPSKSKRELQFQARTALVDGLQQTIDWTIKNFELIERTMSKHREFMHEVGVR